jgi:membrane-associated phospholipid phosphatase
MATSSQARSPGHRRWVALQVGLVAAGIVIYFGVRGLTADSGRVAREHAADVVAFERQLGIQVEGAWQVPVERWPVLATFANWVYIWGHWPVIIGTMVWLVWRHRETFLRLRDAMMVSGLLGMVVFVVYPLAPPRLTDLGVMDTVTQSSSAYRVLQPPMFVNQYAAMPSLHAGWDLLVGIAIISAASSPVLRAVGAVLPVLMALAVVTTGNHYFVDVPAGMGLALLGYAVAGLLARRRRRAAAASPEERRPLPEGRPDPAFVDATRR